MSLFISFPRPVTRRKSIDALLVGSQHFRLHFAQIADDLSELAITVRPSSDLRLHHFFHDVF